jgi:hypothetical protein
MPLPVDSLTPNSDINAINQAISDSIQACMNEQIPEGYDVNQGNKQKWCAGKAYGIARKNTGKSLGG